MLTDSPTLATSWNGWDHGLGTCTVHSWNDDSTSTSASANNADDSDEGDECDNPPMGARLTAQLDHDQRFYNTQSGNNATGGGISSFRRARLRQRQRMGLAAFGDDDEDEE